MIYTLTIKPVTLECLLALRSVPKRFDLVYSYFIARRVFVLFVILYVFTRNGSLYAQDSVKSSLSFDAYGEFYYSYDFSQPSNNERPNFTSNHRRHGELSANLIYVKSNYQKENLRANIGAMVGDYPQYNLNTEPLWVQFIYEANIGLKLSKKRNLWLDIGIMPSHLGFETMVGGECWTLTRSMLAEGSPYYEAGAKLSFVSRNEKFYGSLLLVNGWQRVKKMTGYSDLPSVGFQFQYKPRQGLVLNYSNFTGNAQPESMSAWRQFHNLYVQYESPYKWGLIVGFDLGMDKYAISDYGFWYSPVVILRYKWTSQWTSAMRMEYFSDQHGIIFPTQTINGFQTLGVSINQDYQLNPQIKFRWEYKYLQANAAIFTHQNLSNHAFTSTCIFSLHK